MGVTSFARARAEGRLAWQTRARARGFPGAHASSASVAGARWRIGRWTSSLLFRLLVSHLVPLDDLAVAADTDRVVLAGLREGCVIERLAALGLLLDPINTSTVLLQGRLDWCR